MKIVFSSLAHVELEETILYYENEKEGLGELFRDSVLEAIDKLHTFPELYVQISPNIRRIVLLKFPYNIFYNYSEKRITIVSIAHQRKNPTYTQR